MDPIKYMYRQFLLHKTVVTRSRSPEARRLLLVSPIVAQLLDCVYPSLAPKYKLGSMCLLLPLKKPRWALKWMRGTRRAGSHLVATFWTQNLSRYGIRRLKQQ